MAAAVIGAKVEIAVARVEGKTERGLDGENRRRYYRIEAAAATSAHDRVGLIRPASQHPR